MAKELGGSMAPEERSGIGRKSATVGYCTVTRCGILLLALLFLGSVLLTGLLVYHFAPCVAEPGRLFTGDSVPRSGRSFGGRRSSQSGSADVRLPDSVAPVSYELQLVPFIWPGNFTFSGQVSILLNVSRDTSKLVLHAVDMRIDEAATSVREQPGGGPARLGRQYNDTERQFHVIQMLDKLRAGSQYVLRLSFVGNLNDYLQGFYRSSYRVGNETRWIATTQFQPTDARRAFPCFDEPALKATFQISMARPANMTAISNMPRQRQSRPVEGLPSYVWDHFERSVPMSTYLVAFIVSDFERMSSSEGNVSVWARKQALEQAAYSLKVGPQILRYFEDFFQIKFPLPKIDMVALPDFAAGAMENWGLITYRETAMLYQEGVSTRSSKQRVATVVSHELAHQWFGNLVTPRWWTDLWLNEGFASYVENIGIDAVEPSWRALEQFVVHELQSVFGLDALESSHPISIEVGHPDEINEIFDRISYAKGASIIRMMDHFLTNPVFKRGLSAYLRDRAYRSAEQNDLWAALTKQAHEDGVLARDASIKRIMDTWTLQTGFPVVTIWRDYDKDAAVVTQERFMLRNQSDKEQSETLWWIPLTYTSASKRDFSSTKPSTWMKAEGSLRLRNLGANPQEWLMFNLQQTGYYRVNYDPTNWRLIIGQLLDASRYSQIATINRAQLLDDALNLARAGRLDYSTALDVTSYLAHETDYLPWKAAFTALGFLDSMLIKFQGYDKFRQYTLQLLENVYREVGFVDGPDDAQLKVFTRVDVLTWLCSFGHEDCVRNAVGQFVAWRADPSAGNPVSANLKSVVYCTAIKYGGLAEWDFTWRRYLESNVGSEKDLLLSALGCTRETWLLSRYLDMALSEDSGIRKQDVTRVFGAVSSNVIGQSLAFDYFRLKWDRLKQYFGTSLMTINNIVKSSTKRINTKYELKDLLEFANEHKEELGTATRAVEQAVEQAEANILWLERNHATIQTWLKSNVT